MTISISEVKIHIEELLRVYRAVIEASDQEFLKTLLSVEAFTVEQAERLNGICEFLYLPPLIAIAHKSSIYVDDPKQLKTPQPQR